jgi:hypothetical protein
MYRRLQRLVLKLAFGAVAVAFVLIYLFGR